MGTLVVASSIGVYSPRTGNQPVDESWPRDGVPGAWYAGHKAELERSLDRLEAELPDLRVVRLRPAVTFKRGSASEQRRVLGSLVPTALLKPGRLPIVPVPAGLTLQAVHTDDVAEAYRLAVTREEARGAYNVAAEPLLDATRLAALLGGRPVKVPTGLARVATALTWRAHLQPTSPDWLDLALGVPVLDSTRIREELGWHETRDAEATVREWLTAPAEHAGDDAPPLDRDGDPGRAEGRGASTVSPGILEPMPDKDEREGLERELASSRELVHELEAELAALRPVAAELRQELRALRAGLGSTAELEVDEEAGRPGTAPSSTSPTGSVPRRRRRCRDR